MEQFKSTTAAVLLAVMGVILFSAKAILVKIAYRYNIDAISLMLLRMLFALPVYVFIASRVRPTQKEKLVKKDYLWLVFFGFVGYYMASYFDFQGLKFIKAGLERIVLFVYPTLVVLIGRYFLKTPISNTQIIAIFITYLGVVTAFAGELQLEGTNLYLGVGLIFLSALTYAMYLVGSGWLIPKFGVLCFTSYAMIVSTIGVMLHYWWVNSFTLLSYPAEVYWLAGAMAIFSTVLPSFMVSQSIKIIGSSNFSIIASIGPISTIVLAYFFLDEQLSFLQVLGTIAVIIGVGLVSKKAQKL